MATETLSNITQDEIEYARMTTLIKSELDYQSRMTNAIEDAVENARDEERKYFFKLMDQGLTYDEIKERLMRKV